MDTYLPAIASVCEPLPKAPIPLSSTYTHQRAPVYRPPTPNSVPAHTQHIFTYASDHNLTSLLPYQPSPQQPPVINCYQEYHTPQLTQFSHSSHLQTTGASLTIPLTSTSPFLTPPSTPTSNTSNSSENMHPPLQVCDSTQDSTNPVLRNKLASERFEQYLNQTWPEEPPRRSSSVIRASMYSKIAEILQDESVKGRLKQWVKHTGFFRIENDQLGGEYRACLAVPVVKGRGGKRSTSKGPVILSKRSHAYKLVARLEDFVNIIGTYHNDCKGHHGIRKTYAMVQEDFSYVPRAAVAKYIELCDICSIHRTKGNKQTKTKNKSVKHTDVSLSTNINEATETNSTSEHGNCNKTVTDSDTVNKENDVQNKQIGTHNVMCTGAKTEDVLAERQLDNIIDYIQSCTNSTNLL